MKNTEFDHKTEAVNLYQLQMEGLKSGLIIYPKTLEPLTLVIRKREKKRLKHVIDITS